MAVFWNFSILQPVFLTLICIFEPTMSAEYGSVESNAVICPSATRVSSARSEIECAVACTGHPNCKSFGHATPFVQGSCFVSETDSCSLTREGTNFRKISGTMVIGTTVMFMQRYVGDVSFAKPWTDYDNGFGNSNGDFWLGLRNIKNLLGSTSATWRVEMKLWTGESVFVEYNGMTVGDSSTNYRMSYAAMGDKSSMITINPVENNVAFSTMDRDNDINADSCSQTMSGNGGFWFGSCGRIHPTAVIQSSPNTNVSSARLAPGSSAWVSLKEIRMYLLR